MQSKLNKSSPRLIDYLVIVGCKRPSRNGHSIVQPELLRTYPTIMHSDFSLPNDIVFFCQPEGCYSMCSSSLLSENGSSSSQKPLKSEFFTFSLTDKETNATRFGLCLNFLRPIPRRKRPSLNKRTSRHTSTQDSGSRLPSTSNEHSVSTKKHSQSDTSSSSDTEDSASLVDRPDRPYTHTLTSLCIVSHYPFCRKFEHCLLFLYNLIQKLHESCRPRFAGRQTVWSAITGGNINISHPAVRKSIDEIDTWILRLLSTPSPIAGRTCVKAFLEPSEFGEPVIFALPDKNRFSLVDFPLHLPLQLLGVQKFLKVLFAVLLEQKVLLQSSHCSRLTTCVMSLTALLYPLQYLFAAIPLLPSSLYGAEQLLQAPSPYIIGLPRSFLDSRFSFKLPRDVLLVDLDTQELYGTTAQDIIPKMPVVEEKALMENLNKILQRAEAMDALDDNLELESVKPQSIEPLDSHEGFDPLSFEANQDSINVAIRVAMVLFFHSPNILGGLTEFTRTVRMYPRPVVAFQYERFMKSRLEPSPFTIVVAKTQAVEYFAEWSLFPENEVYRRIASGVYAVSEISDQDQWFSDQLQPVEFSLWTEKFEHGILKPALELIHATTGSAPLSKSKEGHTVAREAAPDSDIARSHQPGVMASSTSGIGEMAACSTSEQSTDLSGSLGDSQSDTDGSSASNEVTNAQNTRSGEKNPSPRFADSVFERPALWTATSFSSSEDFEDLQLGQPLPARLKDYYTPPSTHALPDPPSETNLSRHFMSPPASQRDALSSELDREAVKSSNTTTSNEPEEASWPPTSPISAKPSASNPFRQSFLPSNASFSGLSTRSVSPSLLRPMSPTAASRTPMRRESSPTQERQPRSSSAMANLGAIISSWFIDASKLHEELMDPELRSRRLEIARTENQRFISECIGAVRKGNLPGMFSRRRLQKLLEEEFYRNMALALAFDNFTSLLQGQDDEEGALEEVCFSSWDHFKSFLWLFVQIASGLQASSKPIASTFIDTRGDIISPVGLASAFSGLFSSQAERERLTRGGISSGFLLLELAHTHYRILPTRNKGIGNTPKYQGDATISTPVTPFMAKSRFWGSSERHFSALGTDEAGIPKSPPVSSSQPESEASGGEQSKSHNRSSRTHSPTLLRQRIHLQKSVIGSGSEVGGPDSCTPKKNFSTPNPPTDVPQAASLEMPEGISMKMVEEIVLFPPFKSSRSFGFRYYKGRLLQTAAEPKEVTGKIPPHVSIPALRSNISSDNRAKPPSDGNPDAAVKPLSGDSEGSNPLAVIGLVSKSSKPSVEWTYLFEEAMLNSAESKLWSNMQFWEDMFLDTVTQEREILGLDCGPRDLLQHYSELDPVDRKRLELQEDCLLANTLHNLIAFMVMARVSVEQIRRKARRLLAKSHTGLHYTQKISKLLDCLDCLRGNDIDLVPPLSRQLIHIVYLVGSVWQNTVEINYLEIYSEFLILRDPGGTFLRRWWFDQIINFTYPPNSDMVCLQTIIRGKREHFTFKSATAHQLFNAITSAMKEAASKQQRGQLLTSLGEEVNAIDADTNATVVIRFTQTDFCLHYADNFKTIPLEMIKRCSIPDDDLFSLEAFDPLNRLPFNGYFKTDLALVLLKQWERLIGVAVARRQAEMHSGTVTPMISRSRNNSMLGLEVGV